MKNISFSIIGENDSTEPLNVFLARLETDSCRESWTLLHTQRLMRNICELPSLIQTTDFLNYNSNPEDEIIIAKH